MDELFKVKINYAVGNAKELLIQSISACETLNGKDKWAGSIMREDNDELRRLYKVLSSLMFKEVEPFIALQYVAMLQQLLATKNKLTNWIDSREEMCRVMQEVVNSKTMI